jgi:hypothetical protein
LYIIGFHRVNITSRRLPRIIWEVDYLADYKKLYHKMFNAATDAEILISQAGRMIRAAQEECEELFVESDDTPIDLADRKQEKPKE